MSNTPDDKSVQEAYCKPVSERDPAEYAYHKDLSVEGEALESRPLRTSNCLRILRIPPRRIALCGGGVRGIAHVGVMKALKVANLLKYVKEVIGISAGSLFALLWVLDYTVEQIEKLCVDFDFNVLQNIDILNFPLTYGFDDGQGLEKLITSILRQKGFSENATFEDIVLKHPTHLRCFATELQTSRIRQFGTVSTPKISVKFAIRASMSFPIMYTPVEEPETGALLMDGGLMSNLPLIFLNDKEVYETWGVFFTGKTHKIYPVTGLIDVLRCIFDSSNVMKSLPFMEKLKNHLILIPTDKSSSFDFEQTKEDRSKLITFAYMKTWDFLYSSVERPARRYSAH